MFQILPSNSAGGRPRERVFSVRKMLKKYFSDYFFLKCLEISDSLFSGDYLGFSLIPAN
jgi:hypothetical protein